MDFFIKCFFLITTVFCFSINLTAQNFTIRVAKTDATYKAGEAAKFIVTSDVTGEYPYYIFLDGNGASNIPYNPITSGTIFLQKDEETEILHVLDEPGVVYCKISDKLYGNAVWASAVFSPFDIAPLEAEPSDFDAFWNAAKNEIAAIPIENAELTLYPTDISPNSDTYILKLPNINGRHTYGYLTIPTNKPGPFPAIIQFPPAGSYTWEPSSNVSDLNGLIHLNLSIHNTPPNILDSTQTVSNLNDPNSFYLKQAILGGLRAIEYIYSMDEFDEHLGLGVMGVSQGSGLAIKVAGLDNRVKTLIASNPEGGYHQGVVYGKATGHPYYLIDGEGKLKEKYTIEEIEHVKYYETGYFAKRYNGVSRFFIGYEDLVCPSIGSFSTFNQLNGLKILTHEVENGHVHEKYYSNPSFFKRFLNPASGYFYSSYYISAGETKTIPVGKTTNLSGIIENNDNFTSDFTYEWSVIDGPGSVIFSNIRDISTTASFSQVGQYTIQFKAIDKYGLSTPAKDFTTLFDKVIINVVDCTNEDGDNVCDFNDCDDNNFSIPRAPGIKCNDGDPETFRDVTQADSCTCAGRQRIIMTECNKNGGNIVIEYGEGKITAIPQNGETFYLKIWPFINDIDGNQNNQVYDNSHTPQGMQEVSNLDEGEYVVWARAPGWFSYCKLIVYVSPLESTSCIDEDNDGYCYPDEDCNDNDANFPLSPRNPLRRRQSQYPI